MKHVNIWIFIGSLIAIYSRADSALTNQRNRQYLRRFEIATNTVPVSMDPTESWHISHLWVLTCFLRPLVKIGNNGSITSLLAKRWSITGEGKVYTFYLDPKYRFQDGSKITAEDVAYSISRHFWPGSKSIIADILQDVVVGAEAAPRGKLPEGIEVLSSDVIRFTLKGGYAPFLSILATPGFGILKKSSLELGPLVGSGPMTAIFDTNQDAWIFQKALSSSNAKTASSIRLRKVLSSKRVQELLNSKQVDVALGYADPEVDLSRLPTNYKSFPINTLGVLHLFANLQKKELADPTFREGLSGLIRYCVRRAGPPGHFLQPQNSFLPNGIMPPNYYTHAVPDFSPADFRKLKFKNQIPPHTLRIILRSEYLSPNILTSLRHGFEEAGLKAEFAQESVHGMINQLRHGKYHLAMLGYFGLTPDPDGFIELLNGRNNLNIGHFSLRTLVQGLKSARFIATNKDRLNGYAEALVQFESLNYVVPLFRLNYPVIAVNQIRLPDTHYRYGLDLSELEWASFQGGF